MILAVAEGFEPSIAGLTIRCLTDWATPQDNWLRRRDSNSHTLVYKTSARLSNGATPQVGGVGGIQTLTRSLRDFYALGYITSPKTWWLWVELNHQPRTYETLALIPLELHSRE